MARRRTHHKRHRTHAAPRRRHHSRRRRVSGISDTLTMIGGVAGGVVIGSVLTGLANKFLPLSMQGGIIPSVVGGAAGALIIPRIIKSPIGKDLAAGAIAGAAYPIVQPLAAKLRLAGVGYVYRGTPKLQSTVGAPGFVNNPVNGIGAVRDLTAVGSLFDN